MAAMTPWLPNLLSCLRIGLGPVYLLALGGLPAAPLLIAVTAAISDFVDGRLARLLGATSRAGVYLDVAADGLFLIVAMVGLAVVGWISPLLPAAMVLALAALVRQWLRVPPGNSRVRGYADRAGHFAGIANYAVVLFASGIPLGWTAVQAVFDLSYVVAAINLLPIVLRVMRRS